MARADLTALTGPQREANPKKVAKQRGFIIKEKTKLEMQEPKKTPEDNGFPPQAQKTSYLFTGITESELNWISEREKDTLKRLREDRLMWEKCFKVEEGEKTSKIESLQNGFARLQSEIDKLSEVTKSIVSHVNPPKDQTVFDPENFCIEIDNRNRHFSDFMDWIKKEDEDFAMNIVFKAVPFISRCAGSFYAHYSISMPKNTISDWADWDVAKKIAEQNSFSNETISAFAYNTGKEIEELITKETNNLKETNRTLYHKIMQWYQKTKDEEFAKHFGIEEIKNSKTT